MQAAPKVTLDIRRRGALAALWVAGALVPALGLAVAQGYESYDGEPIRYSASAPEDPISKLQQRIDRGEIKLRFEPGRGYLRSLLRALNIPPSSQILVFSKTSFQRDFISPETPRALYYNDSVYIGFEQGAPALEITAVDPQLGGVFYLLKQDASAAPKFIRQTHECLQCHDSTAFTGGVPGHIMRSVYTDPTGQPILTAGTFITSDQSPLKERWGGWYVTGTHGAQRHMGNILVKNPEAAEKINLAAGANVTDLSKRFDVKPYLNPHSDIVALMVIEHQQRVQNLITRANYETRRALHYEKELNRELKRPYDYRSESTLSRIRSVGEPLVRALLFVGEVPLEGRISGTSTFAADFMKDGPRDRQGRSLRDLDLKTRLMRYPCSYVIYSPEFDALPEPAKDYVYRRLWEVLGGQDHTPGFAALSDADRSNVRDILMETKPGFVSCAPARTP